MQDILVDINNHDIILKRESTSAFVFETIWGKILGEDIDGVTYLNVIVTDEGISYLAACKGKISIPIQASYYQDISYTVIRFLKMEGNQYTLYSDYGILQNHLYQAYAFIPDWKTAVKVTPMELMAIDEDWEILLTLNGDKAYLESSKSCDFDFGDSDDQSAQMLALCNPGNLYRYPLTGIGITNYIHSIPQNSGLSDILKTQFKNDYKSLETADFDSETGGITVSFVANNTNNENVSVSVKELDLSQFPESDTVMRGLNVKKTIFAVEYSDISIYLTYPIASCAGDTVLPDLRYSQNKITTYTDGSVDYEYVYSDAEIIWENTTNVDNGAVVVDKSYDIKDHEIKTVRVIITMNGKTATKEYTIKQVGYDGELDVYNYYIGEVDMKSAEFATLSNIDLIANATNSEWPKDTETGDRNYTSKKKIMYIMIPKWSELRKFAYISDGYVNDIISDNAFNAFHDNIVIDRIQYQIYAYRDPLASEQSPLEYIYNIKI